MSQNPRSDPAVQRVVVVGAGHAGVEVAAALRTGGHVGPLTIIGDEPVPPYQRPPLSKEFLSPATESAVLPLRTPKYFADRGIEVRSGVTATALNRRSRSVQLSDGNELPYNTVVLATGAANRTVSVSGTDLAGIHTLRTQAEAVVLRSSLRRGESMLIVGGGFIGLEVAAAARKHGLTVTVLEAEDRPMRRALSPAMANHLTAAHREVGIDIRLGEAVARFTGVDDHVTGAISTTGERYPADVVLVGIGVVPRDELAVQAGLLVADGIVVDEHLRTADPAIYAIGDCANHPNVHAGVRMRVESVQNATDQARHVAAAILGDAESYAELPWFWSHQGELKLQIAGVRRADDIEVVLGDPNTGRFSVCCYRQGRLAAVESLNRPADHVAARRVLTAGRSPDIDQLHDPAFSLKSFAQDSLAPHRASALTSRSFS
ncbi:FAD-dependent oxidoreductase [Nocardia vinacea]|uniref:NAD(P)/FAD-dependent oxidoreductase n=1 Tax=Nocardia vinacea TaxID=96468 RepID=UPI002E1645E5|nr:FAD-dependent oxidoreductase [Nocardia vinacea]